MSVLDALPDQWKRQWRPSIWGQNHIGSLLVLLSAAYFGLLFLASGWFYPTVVADVAPAQDPLQVLNEYLLYGVIAFIGARFVLQRPAGSRVHSSLRLPVSRSRLARILEMTSGLSLFNVFPLVLFGSRSGSTVLPATTPVGAAFWGVGILFTVLFTQSVNTLLRTA